MSSVFPSPHAQRGRAAWWVTWLTPLVALLAYLALWPTPIAPQAHSMPAHPGYAGVHALNQRLAGLEQLPLRAGQHGPESILAHGGWLYTGLDNGDVLRLRPDGQHAVVLANTGGRPLGLAMDAQGRLLIADAYEGLLRIDGLPSNESVADAPAGADADADADAVAVVDAGDAGQPARVQRLSPSVPMGEGAPDPIRYADAVAVGPDGRIWLTDASRRFGARQWGGTFEASVLDILEHSCTGRLLVFDPEGQAARVVLDGLCFPNGLVFAADGRSVFVAETGTFRVLRLHLEPLARLTHKGVDAEADGAPATVRQALSTGAAQVVLDKLPGYPDNLTRGEGGRLWVGLTKPRSALVDYMAAHPWMRSMTLRLPRALWPVPKPHGHLIAFDEQGVVIDDLQDPLGAYPDTTAATEIDGKLFVQSLSAPTLAWCDYPRPRAPSLPSPP